MDLSNRAMVKGREVDSKSLTVGRKSHGWRDEVRMEDEAVHILPQEILNKT